MHFLAMGYSPLHPYYVYVLVNKHDGEIVYVGCSKNLKRRLVWHRRRFADSVTIHPIAESSYQETALDMESDWIRRLWSIGCPLVNKRELRDNHRLIREIDRELRSNGRP
jgi:hypothetical protein